MEVAMTFVLSLSLLIGFCFKLAVLSSPTPMLSEQGRKELSKNITEILNKLVDTKHYDKRLRPNYGGPPVDVGITIYVSSISAVSEVEMDFTLDFYLRQVWTDPRLAFEHLGVSVALTVGIEYIEHIWVPDTFFPNEKKSYFHKATTHNCFLRISKKGEIFTSQRLTVTATCPMELHYFPLDSQECSLEIESYGYSEDDTRYSWKEGNASITVSNAVRLPQFNVSKWSIKNRTQILSTGNYSRLSVFFQFSRSLGFYMIQIYVPSILIVIISWVSFWLNRDAAPARVALGVTTVLTMTTLMTTTNAAMPKVSYIKAIDMYLGTCFVMVFASLLEYAAVSYLNKKLRMKRERSSTKPSLPVELPITVPKLPHSPNALKAKELHLSGALPLMGQTSNCQSFLSLECDCDLMHQPPRKLLKLPRPRRRAVCGAIVTPSRVDKYSRVVFPVIFIVFNAVYWGAYSAISSVL